jgi:hypothetical protein
MSASAGFRTGRSGASARGLRSPRVRCGPDRLHAAAPVDAIRFGTCDSTLAQAARLKRVPTSRFFHGEDHSAYRGEFLEACRVGGGGAAFGRGERGAQLVHGVPFKLGDQVVGRSVQASMSRPTVYRRSPGSRRRSGMWGPGGSAGRTSRGRLASCRGRGSEPSSGCPPVPREDGGASLLVHRSAENGTEQLVAGAAPCSPYTCGGSQFGSKFPNSRSALGAAAAASAEGAMGGGSGEIQRANDTTPGPAVSTELCAPAS